MSKLPVAASAFRMTPSLVRALRGGPVRVGTENPAKLEAVRAALAALAPAAPPLAAARPASATPSLDVAGLAAASGVPEQPVGWDEIVMGARRRAEAALDAGPCVLAFGIEDGLVELPIEPPRAGRPHPGGRPPAPGDAAAAIFNVGCAWVTDGERSGTGFSSAFGYPPAVARPAFCERIPVGGLFDALWARHRAEASGAAAAGTAAGAADPPGPSGRRGGNIGQLTQGRLDRSAYGAQAILCALVPFLHADLYD